jgi:hypothetical protein
MNIKKSLSRKSIKKETVGMFFSVGFVLLATLIGTNFFDGAITSLSNLLNLSANLIENTLFISSILISVTLTIQYISKMCHPKTAESEANANMSNQAFNGDFEDKELNRLAQKIQNKVNFLQDKPLIKRDIESSLMIEKIQDEYLKAIHESYISIPPNKRGNVNIPDSSYDLTLRQINLILEGLDKIEDKIVNHGNIKQRTNEIFLKEKIIGL